MSHNDVACPFDTRVKEKKQEKVQRYQELMGEIRRLYQCRKVTVTPIIIGTIGKIAVKTHSLNVKTDDHT